MTYILNMLLCISKAYVTGESALIVSALKQYVGQTGYYLSSVNPHTEVV